MKLRISLLALIFVFVISGVSFAAINVEKRTGDIKIFMPDGKQVVIKRNQPLPVIPDGAVITIMAGSAVVSTTGKSVVSVSVGNYTIQVKEVSKVRFLLNSDGTASITVILGQTDIVRKAEAYTSPLLPAAPELQSLETGETGKDISPTT